MYYLKFILLLPCLFSLNSCEVTEEKKAKLLSDFINYYNFRPNVGHRASDGFLRSINEIDQSTYQIEVSFIAKQQHGDKSKMMKCTAAVQDLDDKGIAIVNNVIDCDELKPPAEDPNQAFFTADVQTERPLVNLENEVQSETSINSGEQFIAIPRVKPSAPCIGCASLVNPHAQGVQELASLGVRHLDIHEPNVKHSLDSVIEVERQVQVINGVRYILTLSILFDHCTELKTESCITKKICKVSILVKPWKTLPSGAKYRAILSNNCTEQWLFGDDGEVLPEPTVSQNSNNKDEHTSSDDEIQIKRHEDVQSQPNAEKTLTPDGIKALEEQILPLDPIRDSSNHKADTLPSENIEANKDHIIKVNTTQQYSENNPTPSESSKHEPSTISEDKKKAIDEMLDFLKFSGYRPQNRPQPEDSVLRQKRSYDYDLQLLSLTEDFRDLKQSIENAKYIYEMAQATVNYLNEIDIEVKNRAVKNVIKAEEEEDNEKHFMYIQVQVVIPCDTASCDPKEIQTKICNGVVDSTDKKSPQVLYTFCYADNKETEIMDKAKEIALDDPVLLRLSKEVLRKLESDSTDSHAMKIQKIVSANTRVASGRLTKITMVVDYIDCSKSVSLGLRKKCSVLQHLGSRICEVLVHERQWLKEKKITYTCTERPMDVIITKNKQNNNITVDDPKISEILQDALQYLETQSSKKNKQKIINVNKISTQVLAGFLIKIEFIVGYTNCSNNGPIPQSSKCSLLKNERLRSCRAQVWDRSWIVDGRQMEVVCDEIDNHRSKRQALGGIKEQNRDDQTYRQLAEESLQKYVLNSSDKKPHTLLRIEKVFTQVVEGSLTKIVFVAVPNDTPQGDAKKCHSEIWERRWLNEKVITVTCDIDSHKSKREIRGGMTEQDPDDPTYRQLAEESLQKYVSNNGDKQPHTLLRIEKVFTQVVEGSLTKIDFVAVPNDTPQGDAKKCHSEIWERRWLNEKVITVTCDIDSHKSKREIRGGMTEQDPDDPTYRQLAEESLQKYVSNNGDKQPHTLLRIEKVFTQVVEGSLTKIDFVAVPNNNPQGDTKKCHSEIWERGWLNEKEVTVTCDIDNHKSKRGIPGGLTEQDPNDPTYKQLAEESLQKYVSNNGDKQPHTLLRIEKVFTQVVEGSLTKIDFVAVPNNNPQGDTKKCHSEIWERRWLNEKVITVTCDIDSHKSKREIRGGMTEQDPNDPTYRQLAEESLQKYVSNNGDKQPHTLLRIEKVFTQVVEGSLTKIDFVAVPNDTPQGDAKKCHSEIWERRWLNEKVITVTCDIDSHKSKREIRGGMTEQDPDDPTYRQLAEESLQKYVSNNGDKQPHTLLRIEKVFTQVVEGSLTKIDFVAVPNNNPQGDTKKCHSEIWERGWLNEKEVTVTCDIDNHKSKRGIPGGLNEQDPNDPTYKQLAEESLQKYVSNNGDKQPHTLLRIEKVFTQVVEGSLTKIDFVAVPNNNPQGDTKKCHSEIWERRWLNEKVITVTCDIDSHKSKREIRGGMTEQDPNDPTYRQLAEESLQKYVSNNGDKQPHTLLRIEKVFTQVVEGSLTKIDFVAVPNDTPQGDAKKCHSEIWERRWLNEKEFTVTCDIDSHKPKKAIKGGLTEQDPDDPTYRQLAEESLQKYVSNSGDKKNHTLLRIEKVITQVVAGSLTKIDFVAVPNDTPQGNAIKCHSEIWERPWLNEKEVTVTCDIDSHKSKRAILGGLTEQDPDDPTYRQLAEESLQKYVSNSGDKKNHTLLRIEKVTTQVVAGSLTKIDFVAVPNDTPQGNAIKCHSEIWDRPWLNEKEVTVTCDIDSHKSKRAIPGGLTEQDPNDPIYRQLAEESLQKYVSNGGDKKNHTLLRIEKVITQVVAGSLTKIDFVAVPNDTPQGNAIKCHSEIWERGWLNEKEVTVTCDIDIHRSKREKPGGIKEQNPDDPIYRQLAEESLQKYVSNSGDMKPHTLLRIEKVTTQIVSGYLTIIDFVAVPMDISQDVIQKCHSEILERQWLKEKLITVSCEIDDHRTKREFVGGEMEQNKNHSSKTNITSGNLIEQDPNEPQYLQLANESLEKFLVDSCNKKPHKVAKESMQKFLTNSCNEEPHKVAKVVKVTTQIVSGKLTRLEFIVLPTNTSKSDIFECFAEVWERPLTEVKDIKISCELLFMNIENPINTSYIQWADESLLKYLSDTHNHYPYKVVQIEQATLQGFFTKIIFVASSTDKHNDSLNCVSEILNAPWLTVKTISVICESDTSTDRKQWNFIDRNNKNKHNMYYTHKKIEEEQDVTKPKFHLLALQSLRKFSKITGTLHKLLAINQVTKVSASQNIAYQIKFIANPTECLSNVSNMRALTCQLISNTTFHCKAKVWDQSELPGKKIHVKCVLPEDYLDLLESDEEDKVPDTDNELTETEISKKTQESKSHELAEEALEQYLSYTYAKYVHKVIAIHSHYEYLANDIIEFAISPTECLRNNFKDSIDNCPFVQPRVIHNCKAIAKVHVLFRADNDMKVKCVKVHMSKKKTNNRIKRQINAEHMDDAENEIDEDTMYYYAKSAVSQINSSPRNSNMFKLVTIHAVKSTIQMKAIVVKMYLEVAESYCIRYQTDVNIDNCEEMEGLNHRLCLARIYPAPSDELVIRHVHVVCDDDEREFNALTGLHTFELLRLSIEEIERKPETHFKLVHQGEPQLIPTLEAKNPLKLNFIIAYTNCSKTVDLDKNPYQCYLDSSMPSKSCSSYIWLETATRTIKYINVDCNSDISRQKRSSLNTANLTTDSTEIKDLVDAALAKLEMSSLHRYKQRVLHINSYSSKITTGKVTTIDFDVAYTSCIKYEWVKNVTDCNIIDHLPRRHCIAQIWERLWIHNGQNINVTCEDDETPLEAHIEFESAEMANQLAQQALKHIEAKYPHPQKQKIVRIFSLEKQLVAGIHYKMKVEVGFTHCLALSVQTNCTLDNELYMNRFCRVNVWLRPWTDHPRNFRVSCDFQESVTSDLYHSIQAEHLFYDFITTYNPSYVNDHAEFARRFEIFKANIKKIHELNVHEKGTATYGVTRFTDLTYKEFSSRYTGLNRNLRNNSQMAMKEADEPKINLPANFDWREFDAVTEVKDQGSCGSSWAFSITGNIEGQWRMQSGELMSLSEQQLLDCDGVNKGCGGGLPENAYRTIEEQGGLETELNYPYEGEVDKCLFNKTLAKAKISGAVNITSNETGMALWLVQNGPISIGINANAMQFYVNGISHPWSSYCDPQKLDHAALLVGYGYKEYQAFNKKITYWIVKNSWGTSWGEQGYYRVHRGTGTCGVNRMATSAFIPSM